MAACETARTRAAARRAVLDRGYVDEFACRIGEEFPGSPVNVRRTIAERACEKHSGRVGRSAAAKRFDSEAIVLAVRAHIRHELTNYDRLLMGGVTRSDARAAVAGRVDEIANQWTRSAAVVSASSGRSEQRLTAAAKQ